MVPAEAARQVLGQKTGQAARLQQGRERPRGDDAVPGAFVTIIQGAPEGEPLSLQTWHSGRIASLKGRAGLAEIMQRRPELERALGLRLGASQRLRHRVAHPGAQAALPELARHLRDVDHMAEQGVHPHLTRGAFVRLAPECP